MNGGLITADQGSRVSDREILNMIFVPGFSIDPALLEHAERLDAVPGLVHLRQIETRCRNKRSTIFRITEQSSMISALMLFMSLLSFVTSVRF